MPYSRASDAVSTKSRSVSVCIFSTSCQCVEPEFLLIEVSTFVLLGKLIRCPILGPVLLHKADGEEFGNEEELIFYLGFQLQEEQRLLRLLDQNRLLSHLVVCIALCHK